MLHNLPKSSPSLLVFWQVGYGLAHDLKAVAVALGGDKAGSVAMADPVLDIKVLHAALRQQRAPGIAKVSPDCFGCDAVCGRRGCRQS